MSPGEITEIINDLPCNKSPGLDGHTSEHLKYASSQLSVLLSILKGHCIEFKYYADGIHSGLTPPG